MRDRLITLYALPNDLHLTRAGVAVSVRHGNAVRRNRIKRLCREAFRAAREDMPLGWDYFVVPSMRAELTVKGLAGSLKSLSAQAARSQPPKDGAK